MTDLVQTLRKGVSTFKLDLNLPSTGFSTGSSFFFGGILRSSAQAVNNRKTVLLPRYTVSTTMLELNLSKIEKLE